jgi:CheY-like chemotaxis protein
MSDGSSVTQDALTEDSSKTADAEVPGEVSGAWVQFLRDDLAEAVNTLNNRLNSITSAARMVEGPLTAEQQRNLDQIEKDVLLAADVTINLMRRITTAPSTRPSVLEEYEAPKVRPGRILLVENDDANRDVIMRLFRRFGHEVVPVTNGLEAFQELQGDAIDCVICDLRLPVLGGKALYEQVEERLPHMASRFVFVTGDYTHPDSRAFLERSGRPVVGKPYEVEALLFAVATTLREVGVYAERVAE